MLWTSTMAYNKTVFDARAWQHVTLNVSLHVQDA
jgi:hypothetical protein